MGDGRRAPGPALSHAERALRSDHEIPPTRIWSTFLVGVLGISFAAIFVRLALPAPPVITGFYRMLFASFGVGVWMFVRQRRNALDRNASCLAAAAGVCFGTDLALWNTSIVHASVATATLLVNTTPIHVGLFSILVLRRRLRWGFAIGAGLALFGCAVLLGAPRGGGDEDLGVLLALAAAIFYAGYLLLMKSARRGIDALPALFLASVTATGVLGVYGCAAGDAFRGFPPSSWWAMAGAAAISQVAGVMGIVWSLGHLPATVASVALLAQPVGTAILGWALLAEPLGFFQLAGGGTVLAGIFVAARSAEREAGPIEPSGRVSRDSRSRS